MHLSLLLLAILELPGGLRMHVPHDQCVVIDARGDVELHRGADKTAALTIMKADDYGPATEAGEYCYFVDPDTVAFERFDTSIKQPRTDAPCSYRPLLDFSHVYGGGTTSFIRHITIWSDGEVSGDFKGSLTSAQLRELRRLIADPAFIAALDEQVEHHTEMSEPSSITIATPDGAATFFVELVEVHELPGEVVTITTDGIPQPVRKTLRRLRAVLGDIGNDMEIGNVDATRDVYKTHR